MLLLALVGENQYMAAIGIFCGDMINARDISPRGKNQSAALNHFRVMGKGMELAAVRNLMRL
jgi:hypothetical protein